MSVYPAQTKSNMEYYNRVSELNTTTTNDEQTTTPMPTVSSTRRLFMRKMWLGDPATTTCITTTLRLVRESRWWSMSKFLRGALSMKRKWLWQRSLLLSKVLKLHKQWNKTYNVGGNMWFLLIKLVNCLVYQKHHCACIK